jgi:formamidopyrimidine-DNA glycosylase
VPELPDIELYVDKIRERVAGAKLLDIRIHNPFLLRSVTPTPAALRGRRVAQLRRIGKRVAIGLDDDFWLLIHLMIAGRFQWHESAIPLRTKAQLAAFDFSSGTLLLTEAGTKKRASLHLVEGDRELATHDPGGLEPLECSFAEFASQLAAENHTLKRALTNPRWFSGIGNAYSDEILHAARLPPTQLTKKLTSDEIRRLYDAMRSVLQRWRLLLIDEYAGRFPDKVSAFRPQMAAHGRFGKPCPDCGNPIQRIRYKSSETNYCARCQSGGRIYADRSLSRLLKGNWPTELDR